MSAGSQIPENHVSRADAAEAQSYHAKEGRDTGEGSLPAVSQFIASRNEPISPRGSSYIADVSIPANRITREDASRIQSHFVRSIDSLVVQPQHLPRKWPPKIIRGRTLLHRTIRRRVVDQAAVEKVLVAEVVDEVEVATVAVAGDQEEGRAVAEEAVEDMEAEGPEEAVVVVEEAGAVEDGNEDLANLDVEPLKGESTFEMTQGSNK